MSDGGRSTNNDEGTACEAGRVWHGTPEDGLRLLAAVREHCTCVPHGPLCPTHELLTTQASLDRLARAGERQGRPAFVSNVDGPHCPVCAERLAAALSG